MAAYLFQRLLSLIVVLFFVVTITFFLIRAAPGSPFDRERKIPQHIEQKLLEKYKLDGTEGRQFGERLADRIGFSAVWKQRCGGAFSLAQQYVEYLADLLRGDLRLSTRYRNRSVNEILAQTLPVSLALGALSFCLATVGGVWLGTLAATHKNTWIDTAAMLLALFSISIPTFVIGPVFILLFALNLGSFLPPGGWGSFKHLVMPSITLALPYVAYIARLMRSSMLETISEDFIRTARAKGLNEKQVVYKHALKVAILPVISFLGPLAANLLTGSIVVESIFNIPGAGGFFIHSILNRDGFLLGGVVMVYCTLLVSFNFVVDVGYTVLDKRIKLYG